MFISSVNGVKIVLVTDGLGRVYHIHPYPLAEVAVIKTNTTVTEKQKEKRHGLAYSQGSVKFAHCYDGLVTGTETHVIKYKSKFISKDKYDDDGDQDDARVKTVVFFKTNTCPYF